MSCFVSSRYEHELVLLNLRRVPKVYYLTDPILVFVSLSFMVIVIVMGVRMRMQGLFSRRRPDNGGVMAVVLRTSIISISGLFCYQHLLSAFAGYLRMSFLDIIIPPFCLKTLPLSP